MVQESTWNAPIEGIVTMGVESVSVLAYIKRRCGNRVQEMIVDIDIHQIYSQRRLMRHTRHLKMAQYNYDIDGSIVSSTTIAHSCRTLDLLGSWRMSAC